MEAPHNAVVVGVDGSEDAELAAAWAVTEADRRGAPVQLVTVNDDPARTDHAERALREAADNCHTLAPNLAVDSELVHGRPVEELLRRSKTAQLVVLGRRGRGGFADALLGGVSSAVATHGSCPVVVVREDVSDRNGHVVVGLDGSESSKVALHFAFEAAQRGGAELIVVEAWHEEGLLAVPLPPYERERVERELDHALDKQVSSLSDQFPDVRLRTSVRRGHPVAALTDASRDAQLLVVGHRGRGSFDGLFLGSIAAGVLNHARCPVAVVRALDSSNS